MILTPAFLNTFVAPHFAEFTAIDAPDMSAHDPEQTSWVANFILNSGFSVRFVEGKRQLAMGFLRRAEAAFVEYEAGRHAALSVVKGAPSRVSRYFEALHRFEVFVSAAYQGELLVGKLVEVSPLFKEGDRSTLARLNIFYNLIKHSDDRIEAGQFPSDGTVPIWLTNAGIECVECKLTFQEMGELLADMAIDATNISNPDRMRSESTEARGTA